MSFEIEYNERKKYIDGLILRELNEFKCPSETLLEAVKYSAMTGGKRLRAILALEFFGMYICKVDRSIELFAVAIELLHLYTLIHDDLPCMDNDDYRRGVPTNHKVFGETMALLSGDALLNKAYELMFKGCALSQNKDSYLDACALFSHLVGMDGVIGGQALEFEKVCPDTKESVLEIYSHKTCDLICASSAAGAIIAGACNEDIEKVKEFSYHFGIAFQIRDDLLDIIEKGNAPNNSLVGLIGEQNANNILNENIYAALSCLDTFGAEKTKFLRCLTEFAAKGSM